MFGARLPLAAQYADTLAGAGTVRGLVGPREVPRLWDRHLLNCAAVGDLVPDGVTLCDVGTGAGLPGIVLAIRRPDLAVTLVEPLLRRTTFLDETVAELGLDNVEVVRARAEALHGRRRFGVVTSRAVAPLTRLAQWCVPLVDEGGLMLAMKGAAAEEEVAEAGAMLAALGAADVEVVRTESSPTTVVRARIEGVRPLGWAERRGAGDRPARRRRTGRRS